MNYNYKYRLYPSEAQQSALESTLDTCRNLYNKLLELVRERGSEYTNNQQELTQILYGLKDTSPWTKNLSNIHSRVEAMVARRLRKNITNATRKFDDTVRPDRLRFKGKNWYKTFTYHQSGFKLHTEDTWLDTLYLSKIGMVPIRFHRELPEHSEIKQVTVKKSSDGEWYAIFGIEVSEPEPPDKKNIVAKGIDLAPRNPSETVVGEENAHNIDTSNVVALSPSISGFLEDSDDREIPSLPSLDHKISCARNKLNRTETDSNNHQRQKQNLAKVEKKERRKQYDTLHKLSTAYVRQYDIILFEKRYLGYDNELWWEFMERLMYKAESAGTLFVPVSLDDEEQLECSECGTSADRENWFTACGCPSCHQTEEPVNINRTDEVQTVLERGLNQLGLEWSDVKPVDTITARDAVSLSDVFESGSLEQ